MSEEHDIRKMKVADLKRELKLRGLSTTGNKNELQDRLQTALLEGDISLEDTAMLDVLSDEEEKAILATEENELLTSSPSESPIKTTMPETVDSNNKTIPKKVVLKRKTSYTVPPPPSTVISKENTEPTQKIRKNSEINPITTTTKSSSVTESKTVSGKISQLTLQERLAMRAKKFGLNTTTASVGGDGSSLKSDTATTAGLSDAKQIEMLKKRAERFGCIVSNEMKQMKANERLLKRKERFGEIEIKKDTKNNNVDAYAEKARLRLQRFETTSNSAIAAATK